MGVAPAMGKKAVDAEIAKGAGIIATGLGDSSARLATAVIQPSQDDYGKNLISAADYMRTFGIPESVEVRMRDDSRMVFHLDPDIACKQSWSMSVKIMTQRQRNYDRLIERLKVSGFIERKRQALTKLLGFEWPW